MWSLTHHFFIIGPCLGFSNTSHYDSFDLFRESVVDKVKIDVLLKKVGSFKRNFYERTVCKCIFQNLGVIDPTTCVYQLIKYKYEKITEIYITSPMKFLEETIVSFTIFLW